MSDNNGGRKFSDVSKAYNHNLANLNEARRIFENEIGKLVGYANDHLESAIKRMNGDEKMNSRFRWEDPETEMRKKDGPWLNFSARSSVGLHIRAPGAKNFKKNAAYLIFEVVFDGEDTSRFVFQARFENQNSVHDGIDEKIMDIVLSRPKEWVAEEQRTGVKMGDRRSS